MQAVPYTPAESLFERLLFSEKLGATYRVSMQRGDHFTCISLEAKAGKAFSATIEFFPTVPRFHRPGRG